MQVDAHHHLWDLARDEDYGWLSPDETALYRDFLPEDFLPVLRRNGIERSVLIQAAPSVAETEWMLALSDRHDFIAAVVGWVDFAAADSAATLAGLGRHPRFRGVRPMIQDIADTDWMLRPELVHTYRALVDLDLSFDALIQPRHLSAFRTLLERHPDLRVVINHCGKPEVKDWRPGDARFRDWADHMHGIARETGACCKLSALPTRAAPGWTARTFLPYVEVLWDAFGPERLMWASDWPVLQRNGEYDDWRAAALELLGVHEEAAPVFGQAARDFYRF